MVGFHVYCVGMCFASVNECCYDIELAMDGDFLSSFRWDSGGEWNGKPWGPYLPSDAQVYTHITTVPMPMEVSGA